MTAPRKYVVGDRVVWRDGKVGRVIEVASGPYPYLVDFGAPWAPARWGGIDLEPAAMIARRKRRRVPTSRGFDLEVRHPQRRWLTSCAGKDRYTSEAAARAGIGLQLGQPALDVYPCDHCAGWHLTQRTATGQRKAPPLVYALTFVCAGCRAHHGSIAASSTPWTPASIRSALLKLEPEVLRDGWSIGAGEDSDHCPACAAALGLETLRSAA